jgi:hypothetical protein
MAGGIGSSTLRAFLRSGHARSLFSEHGVESQLSHNAFVLFDIGAPAQIPRPMKPVALLGFAEVSNFNHCSYGGQRLIGRDSHGGDWNPPLAIEEPEFNATVIVHFSNYCEQRGGRFVHLCRTQGHNGAHGFLSFQ